MFIKIRRDTLIILLLAFILILCGRLITYVAYASSDEVTDGVPISGIIVKGNDVVPVDIIRSNVMQSGLRDGSVIHGDILKTSKKRSFTAGCDTNGSRVCKTVNSSRNISCTYFCCRCSGG